MHGAASQSSECAETSGYGSDAMAGPSAACVLTMAASAGADWKVTQTQAKFLDT